MDVPLASADDALTTSGGATGIPAPYGRACANCSRAKCRCTYRRNGTDCERCHRLKKDCRPSVSVRRRAAAAATAASGSATAKKRSSSSTLSRTAQLEQKLEGLVSLLTAQTQGGQLPTSPNQSAKESAGTDSSPNSFASHRHAGPVPSTAASGGPGACSGMVPPPPQSHGLPLAAGTWTGAPSCARATHLPRTPESTTCSSGLGGYQDSSGGGAQRDILNMDPSLEPTAAEAEHSLQTFRTTMLPYFPCMRLAADVTAAQLRRTRPVLWLAVMTVSYQRAPPQAQLALSRHLRSVFAQRIVVESDKSLDLLQALVVFLTWVHYASKSDRHTLSVMSQLAVTLVYDLGLHTFASPCKLLMTRLLRDHHPQALGIDEPPSPPPQMDDRRAALACYVLTSKLSIGFRRCEPLRWTERLEEHLHALAQQAETPLDHVLATQVRLQRLVDHMHQGDWLLDDPGCAGPYAGIAPDASQSHESPPESRLLPSYVIRIVQAKIDEIRDNIPPEARNYDGVLEALYSAEMMLSAGAVLPVVAPVVSMASMASTFVLTARARHRADCPSDSRRDSQPAEPAAPARPLPSSVSFARVAALERCVEAVAAFWAFFRKITSGSYTALPFAFYAHFTYCVVLLYGLSVVDEPLWDRTAVRNRLHVLDMLDGFIAKLRDAPRVEPNPTVTGPEACAVFNRAAIMLSSVRELWAADASGPGHGERELPLVPPAMCLGHAPMTLDVPPPSAQGTAWPLAPEVVAATAPAAPTIVPAEVPTAAATPAAAPLTDMAMGEAHDFMLPSNGEFFADLSSAMGLPEDDTFWRLFLDGLPPAQL